MKNTSPPVISFLLIKIKKLERDLKLPYIQRIYRDIDDQSSSNIYKLKKRKYKVRLKNGIYQLLLSEKKIATNSKRAIIDKILNMKCKDDISLIEHIENWFSKSIDTTGYIDNQYNGILDILATYYLTNGKDISVLTDKKLKKIEKYEVASFTDKISDVPNIKWFSLEKMDKEKLEKYYNRNKKKTKSWKRTYTYKINQLRNEKEVGIAKWSYVDTDGIFEFDNKKFIIKNENQYKVSSTRLSKMDNILCIKTIHNEYLFYNMHFTEINRDNIYPIINC